MNSALNGFNAIARQYDFLKRIVFGKAIYKSQAHFLASIPPGGNVLFLGGGSGEILPVLLKTNPGCQIWFVEASSEMLRIANDRLGESLRKSVRFIHGTESTLPAGITFDTVITCFFLDLFSEARLPDICSTIVSRLDKNGLWIVSDFVAGGKRWQTFLLRFMYRFFALVSRIEATRLPPWQNILLTSGLMEIDSHLFYGGFIKSSLYMKKP